MAFLNSLLDDKTKLDRTPGPLVRICLFCEHKDISNTFFVLKVSAILGENVRYFILQKILAFHALCSSPYFLKDVCHSYKV